VTELLDCGSARHVYYSSSDLMNMRVLGREPLWREGQPAIIYSKCECIRRIGESFVSIAMRCFSNARDAQCGM
jgi:hypothetical protein